MHELYGIGRIFEKREQYALAVECYSKCTTTVNIKIKELSLKRLALIYRRNKDFSKTIECLESILTFSEAPNILVRIELAKHYEHRVTQLQKAIKLVLDALEICSQTSFIKDLYYEDLKSDWTD